MQSTLTVEYHKAMKEFAEKAADPVTHETKDSKPAKSNSAESLANKKETIKLGNHLRSDSSSRLKSEGGSMKRAPTRRRSFDQAVKKVKEQSDIIATMAAMVEVNTSEKAATAAPEPVADSWDSVTTQPFCTVCQMAFKSQPFLDRHVKYSDLHTKNVKKAQGIVDPIPEEKVVEAAATSPVKTTELPEHLFQKQVEGVHYKLLYSGSSAAELVIFFLLSFILQDPSSSGVISVQ